MNYVCQLARLWNDIISKKYRLITFYAARDMVGGTYTIVLRVEKIIK